MAVPRYDTKFRSKKRAHKVGKARIKYTHYSGYKVRKVRNKKRWYLDMYGG